ncbi:eukaryotic translation initiation factor 3 subunit C, partial [Trifolium medium]|nr:eukaryotic translation initiation factor 3 subunit C [Trifolium medium]
MRARSKGNDKWTCFHCQEKGHFKRDYPELKGKGDSAHVVDSLDAGYEIAEALVVSSWEPEE